MLTGKTLAVSYYITLGEHVAMRLYFYNFYSSSLENVRDRVCIGYFCKVVDIFHSPTQMCPDNVKQK